MQQKFTIYNAIDLIYLAKCTLKKSTVIHFIFPNRFKTHKKKMFSSTSVNRLGTNIAKAGDKLNRKYEQRKTSSNSRLNLTGQMTSSRDRSTNTGLNLKGTSV